MGRHQPLQRPRDRGEGRDDENVGVQGLPKAPGNIRLRVAIDGSRGAMLCARSAAPWVDVGVVLCTAVCLDSNRGVT